MIRSSSAGTPGFSRTTGTGVWFRIASDTTPVVSPRKGSLPVAISYKTTPNENKSVRASSGFPRTCSGDMYATVPTVAPGLVRSSSGAAVAIEEMLLGVPSDERSSFANPKSRILR